MDKERNKLEFETSGFSYFMMTSDKFARKNKHYKHAEIMQYPW